MNTITFDDGAEVLMPKALTISRGDSLNTSARRSYDYTHHSQEITRRRYTQSPTWSIQYTLGRWEAKELDTPLFDLLYSLEDAVGRTGVLSIHNSEKVRVIVQSANFGLIIDGCGDLVAIQVTLNLLSARVVKAQNEAIIRAF